MKVVEGRPSAAGPSASRRASTSRTRRRAASRRPATLWLDERLASALGAKPGDEIGLGRPADEDGGGAESFERTGAPTASACCRGWSSTPSTCPPPASIQPGSRVFYRLHVAGRQAPSGLFGGLGCPACSAASASRRRQRPARKCAPPSTVPSASCVLRRCWRWCWRRWRWAWRPGVSSNGIWMAARVMRCRGGASGQLMRLFIGEFVLLGCCGGWAVCSALRAVCAGLLGSLVGISAAGAGRMARWCTGWRYRCCCSWVLRLPPLIRLGRCPLATCCVGEWNGMAAREGWLAWAAGALVLAGLLVAIARLAARRLGGGRLCAGLCGYGFVAGWRFGCWGGCGRWPAAAGVTALRRRCAGGRWRSLVQVLALAMGLTALVAPDAWSGGICSPTGSRQRRQMRPTVLSSTSSRIRSSLWASFFRMPGRPCRPRCSR